MSAIVCLSSAELAPLLPLSVAVEAVKEAYVLHATGEGKLLPLVRERLAPDAMFGIKTGFIASQGVLGLKAGGSWKGNKSRGQEAHQATVVLIDPATGRPLAFMDGNHITTIRTGAAGAVGCELFAAPNARVLAVIGTGVQGIVQTEAALHARPGITEVRCFNPHGPVAERYRRAFEERVELCVCRDVAEAVEGADVVVTATPSTEPLVFREQLEAGAHVNAVGSDSAGKRELDAGVLRAAQVFVDDPSQSRRIGELQGLDDVEAVAVGDVLRGAHPGRQGSGITVFDSTGISLQDLTSAWRAYRLALDRGIGTRLEW
jgi:ornithine cyclodeaminase/alanine dehydrogenase-like protein (mu-crystallin family)